MKVLVFGCLHGMLDEMYKSVERIEHRDGIEIDLILVCGDCQTIRHHDDLKCLSVPNKYKKTGDFWAYYAGKKRIPRLTIMIGGNHEASSYLMALPYGGWVCDNFYYLGYAGVIKYNGLRIAGVSGIHNNRNCNKGRYERMPLDEQSIKSVYHTRRLDIFRLQLLSKNAIEKNPIDIFLSHDWPARVYDHGNKEQLMRFKPQFTGDINSREGLGSPLTEPLVNQLKPKRWFAAHLHCRFYAKVKHQDSSNRCTEFLSLNKIENKKNFMELLDIVPSKPDNQVDNELYYDEEWLTILKKTINLESTSFNNVFCPKLEDDKGQAYLATDEEIKKTVELMDKTGGMKIERNFAMSEPVIYDRPNGVQPSLDQNRVRFYPNPQTEQLSSRLELTPQRQQNPNSSTSSEIKLEPIKTAQSKSEAFNFKPVIKIEIKEENDPPAKKRAVSMQSKSIELDDEGCLPFYIDTKGEK